MGYGHANCQNCGEPTNVYPEVGEDETGIVCKDCRIAELESERDAYAEVASDANLYKHQLAEARRELEEVRGQFKRLNKAGDRMERGIVAWFKNDSDIDPMNDARVYWHQVRKLRSRFSPKAPEPSE
jgi:hypothetical protein